MMVMIILSFEYSFPFKTQLWIEPISFFIEWKRISYMQLSILVSEYLDDDCN